MLAKRPPKRPLKRLVERVLARLTMRNLLFDGGLRGLQKGTWPNMAD